MADNEQASAPTRADFGGGSITSVPRRDTRGLDELMRDSMRVPPRERNVRTQRAGQPRPIVAEALAEYDPVAEINDGDITEAMLADLAVTTAKLAGGAATAAKIASNAITTVKLANLAITEGKLADGSVATAKLANLAVDADKLADAAVSTSKLADLAVVEGKLADASVVTAKLGSGSVTEVKLGDGSVATIKLAEGSVTTSKLGDASVTTTKLEDGSITEAKLGSGSVTSVKLEDGSVVEAKLGSGSVTSVKLGDEAVTTAKLGATSVTTAKLANGSVTTIKIGDDEITTDKLQDSSVVTAKINDAAVEAAKIASGAISQSKLASGLFVPEIVGSLPGLPDAGYPEGALVFLTTDGKLYRNVSDSWTAAVAAGDLSGTVDLDTQVSGTLSSSFAEAGLINSNVTINSDGSLSGAGGGQASLVDLPGTIAAGQIAAGAVTTAKLDALAVTAAKIAAGAIETSKIAAGAVTADEIEAGTITAAEIATGTITANEIESGTITAALIAANTITAAEIEAATITGTELAARAIAARHLFVGSFDNLVRDPSFEQGGSLAGGASEWRAVTGAGGVWTRTDATPRSGGWCVEFDATSQGTSTARLQNSRDTAGANQDGVACAEGDQFYARARIRSATAGTWNRARVVLRFRDEVGAILLSVNGSLVIPTTTYQLSEVTGTAPAGATQLIVELVVLGDENGGLIRFDDVYARRMVEGSIVVDGTITADHIEAATITAAEIASGTIVAANIASGTITAAEIASGTITAGEIASGTITAAEIASGTITATEIASGTITATEIASGTITAAEIEAGTITAAEIEAGTITVTELTIDTLSSIDADMGELTAGSIVIGTTNKIWLNDADDGGLHIGGATKASAPFSVAADGTLTATGATITGTVTIGAGSSGIGNLSDAGGLASLDTVDTVQIEDGAITAAKITVTELSAIEADMGELTAGQIVLGTTNKLWLNDSDDGGLHIGGATKGSAPFSVAADGTLTATGASISGTVTIGSGSSGVGNLSDAGALASEDDVDWSTQVAGAGKPDDNADVTSANQSATTATLSNHDADELGESASRKWAGESGADVTANNAQGVAWLTDAGDLASLDQVDTVQIADGAITAAKITAGTITANELSGNQLDVLATNTGTLDVDEAIRVGSATAFMTGEGIWIAANGGDAEFRAGDPAGAFISFEEAAGEFIIGPDVEIQAQLFTASEIHVENVMRFDGFTFLENFEISGDRVAFQSPGINRSGMEREDSNKLRIFSDVGPIYVEVAGEEAGRFTVPGVDTPKLRTSMWIVINNGGNLNLRQVYAREVNTGGTGFRGLSVLN